MIPEGQLTQYERDFLRNAVIAANPHLVFEVGTWKGGGSTNEILCGLLNCRERGVGNGFLITCEVDDAHWQYAHSYFQPWAHVITCLHAPSHQVLDQLLGDNSIPDFLFFDGPEDSSVALNDLQRLEPKLVSGAYFAMHDWELGVRVADGLESIKAALVRPYVEHSPRWTLCDKIGAPNSVGLCLYRFNG